MRTGLKIFNRKTWKFITTTDYNSFLVKTNLSIIEVLEKTEEVKDVMEVSKNEKNALDKVRIITEKELLKL